MFFERVSSDRPFRALRALGALRWRRRPLAPPRRQGALGAAARGSARRGRAFPRSAPSQAAEVAPPPFPRQPGDAGPD